MGRGMATQAAPLEDELGDVLDKAMQWAGLSLEATAGASGVPLAKIQDAIDYRSELSEAELTKLAGTLHLNEVGLCALACGRYPLPECKGLPFALQPIRMVHGVGVANAYLVAEPGTDRGVLFDTGPSLDALLAEWPGALKRVDAVFLTHVEGEHTGGLCDVVDYFGIPAAFVPAGCKAPCGEPLREGETRQCGGFEITAYSTPGHAAAHNCYRVRHQGGPRQTTAEVLVVGDLIFAGSAGGAYHCCVQQQRNLRRILQLCPGETMLAPGHGPLTTVANELRYNPFVP